MLVNSPDRKGFGNTGMHYQEILLGVLCSAPFNKRANNFFSRIRIQANKADLNEPFKTPLGHI